MELWMACFDTDDRYGRHSLIVSTVSNSTYLGDRKPRKFGIGRTLITQTWFSCEFGNGANTCANSAVSGSSPSLSGQNAVLPLGRGQLTFVRVPDCAGARCVRHHNMVRKQYQQKNSTLLRVKMGKWELGWKLVKVSIHCSRPPGPRF